jgi:hypothetical protein
MSERIQLISVYLGYAFLVLFFGGFGGLAGFVPPPSPTDSAHEIQRMFLDNTTGIRAGMIVSSFAAALTLPWAAAICVQIRRIERRNPVLTYIWIAGAGCFTIEFVYPFAIYMAASFRPDEAPDILRHFNDLGWLALLSIVSTAIVQAFALGVAVLRDDRETPLYPRWFAYFCFWSGTLFVPAGLIVFFKTGAFAWNGIVSWWFVVVIFGVWVIVTTQLTARAIKVPDEHAPDDLDGLRDEVARLGREVARLQDAR